MPLRAWWATTDSPILKSLCNMPKYSYRDTTQCKITCGFSSLNVCCFPVFGITDLKPIPFGQYWLRSFDRKWLQTKAVTIENTTQSNRKWNMENCVVTLSHSISSGGFKNYESDFWHLVSWLDHFWTVLPCSYGSEMLSKCYFETEIWNKTTDVVSGLRKKDKKETITSN